MLHRLSDKATFEVSRSQLLEDTLSYMKLIALKKQCSIPGIDLEKRACVIGVHQVRQAHNIRDSRLASRCWLHLAIALMHRGMYLVSTSAWQNLLDRC